MMLRLFKVTVPSRTVVGYLEQIANAGMKIHCAIGICGIFVCWLFQRLN
jgi:hypothetical protein